MKFIRSNPLLVFLAIYFIVRIPLFDWYAAPLTDELDILDQTFFGPGQRLPLFPSLIDVMRRMGADPLWSAKLISQVSGVLTVVPAFYMAQKLVGFNHQSDQVPGRNLVPWVVAILVAISPLLVRWSLRGMTDMSFTLFLTAAVAFAVYWVEDARTSRLGGVIAFSGFAMLTRPEGLLAIPLLPLLVVVHLWRHKGEGLTQALKSIVFSSWSWVPWGIWVYWRVVVNAKGSYASTFDRNLKRIDPAFLGEISAHFGGYAFTTLYILGPVICLGCVLYFSDLLERPNRLRVVSGLGFIYFATATWFIACVHYFFSIRHMIFVYPTLIVVGTIGLWAYSRRWPRLVWALTVVQILCSIFVLSIGLWVTQDTFKDIKEAAIAANQDGYKGPLRAWDYRQKKTGYYFDGKVIHYDPKAPLQVGDRVMLVSYYLSKQGVEKHLELIGKRYAYKIISDQRSRQSQFFTDDITTPTRDNGKVSKIMSKLFVWQTFRSVVVEILGPRSSADR